MPFPASPSPQPRPRHRSPSRQAPAAGDPAPDSNLDEDTGLDSYLAALAPKSGADDTELTGRFGHSQVFQLRLPALRIEQLRRIARERGVSPGALAVEWVVERLDREDTPTGPLPLVGDDEPRRRGLRRRGRR